MKKTAKTSVNDYPNQSQLLSECVSMLMAKQISDSTLETILTPMQQLDIEEKEIYAGKLLAIFETSKTEEEILQRASKNLRILFFSH